MTQPHDRIDYANDYDRELAGIFDAREDDWRAGAVVYQLIVDRFAPSANLEDKRDLYPAPKTLRSWEETPQHGHYLADQQVWSHEIDFWGGDLASTRTHLDHVAGLGADVLYLTPIHDSSTNHRYDALDYTRVAPEYGTREDVTALADDLHLRGMKLVLDGVFNHVGRSSALFCEALQNPDSEQRQWFAFDDALPGGVRVWQGAQNLPELNLENPATMAHVLDVVRGWLRDGADGWRLDVAFDIGMRHLGEITAAAHDEKPGSLVLGEISSYPREWFPSLDGLLHFTLRGVLLALVTGKVSPAHGQAMLERMYADADADAMLRSWLYLDNHDTSRLATLVPDERARAMAMVLAHTLPGSVNLYYGSELGMTGGDDPEMRAPMRWDLVDEDNPWLRLTRDLVRLRHEHRALRIGNIRWLVTERLVGYQRHTDRARDMVVVLVNPSDEEVSEMVLVPDSKLVSWTTMVDLLGGPDQLATWSAIEITLPPHGHAVLVPQFETEGGYSAFKRLH